MIWEKKIFFETTLKLNDEHNTGLRVEGIMEPNNFGLFISNEVAVLIKNLTNHSPPILLPGVAQVQIRL